MKTVIASSDGGAMAPANRQTQRRQLFWREPDLAFSDFINFSIIDICRLLSINTMSLLYPISMLLYNVNPIN